MKVCFIETVSALIFPLCCFYDSYIQMFKSHVMLWSDKNQLHSHHTVAELGKIKPSIRNAAARQGWQNWISLA